MNAAPANHNQPPLPPDDSHPTRLSLLNRLKDWEDDRSWREFFDLYWRLIYSVALKSGLTETEAQDVVQETVLSVAKKVRDFQYDPSLGSFKGWLLQLTGWRIANQFQKRLGGAARTLPPEDGTGTATVERIPDPAALADLHYLWDREWEDHLLQRAMDRIRRTVNPAHFQIFDLAVVRRQSVSEVARFLGVSAGRVYLAKHRVARLVQKEIRRLQDCGV